MGLTSNVKEFQLDYIDEPLRNRLWNLYGELILSQVEPDGYNRNKQDGFTFTHWQNFFKKNYDEAPYSFENLKGHFKRYFFSTEWYNVYNLIEFGLKLECIEAHEQFIRSLNKGNGRRIFGFSTY